MEAGETVTPASSSAPARKSGGPLLRIGRLAALVFVGMCVVLYALQDSIIFPGRASQGQKHAIIRESPAGDYQLVHLTTRRGDKTVALFSSARDERGRKMPDAASRPTLYFFYGNGMCLADCFSLLDDFRRLGINVLIVEYVGYGMSSGKPTETSLYETADAAWEHLQSRDDIDKDRIIVGGWSLGAAVAVDQAQRRPVIGLATFSAFTSMRQMARSAFPWLPTSWLLKYDFDSETKIGQVKVPVFIAHGRNDRIIPFWMSQRLEEAASRSPRVFRITLESDHNDLFDMQDLIFGPFGEFVASLN